MAAAGELVKFFIEGVCTSLLGLFGIIGNLVSMAVLSSSELDMMPSFRHLLKMLAAFDATFLVFTLTLFGISPWSDDYDQFIKPYLMPYFLPIIQISLTGSVWTTMAVSVERYLTVCLSLRGTPTMMGGDCSRHLLYSLPIVGLSIIFNIPRFFELRTEMAPSNQTLFNEALGENETTEVYLPIVVPTKIRDNLEYSRDYVLIANSVALVFIPILTLIVLNSLIFRTISRATQRHNAISSNQRRDHSVAMMLIFVVAVFVVCHSIRSIINGFECVQFAVYGKLEHWPHWIQMLVHVNHFALVVNSSINILIYSCKDEKFRNVMLVTLGLTRFIRNSANTTAAAAHNNGQNGVQRNGGQSSEMRIAPTTTTRNMVELQSVVTTYMSKSCETRVTTALLPSSGVVTSSVATTAEKAEAGSVVAKNTSNAGGNVVTVVEINGGESSTRDFCKIIKESAAGAGEKASSPVLDSSVHCEECCRSCSCCGETVYSSAESSIVIDEVQALVPAANDKEVSKTTISTQTSLTNNSE